MKKDVPKVWLGEVIKRGILFLFKENGMEELETGLFDMVYSL